MAETYVCRHLPSDPIVTGDLDRHPWFLVPWSGDFVDIQGDSLPKPALLTRMKMFWNEHGLWIGAMMEEPHLWATQTEHDSVIFHENDFEVFLDPDDDGELYLELEINALNTTWDLLLTKAYKKQGKPLDSFEVKGMQTAVKLSGTLNDPRDTDDGWSVEILLPWRSLREISNCPVPPKAGDRWRINFSRVQWHRTVQNGQYVKVPDRPEENWVWSPQGEIDMHIPENWGYLEFA